MKLDDFRSVADEKLGRIEMTPELKRKIIHECTRRARPVGKAMWIAAAACFVLMAVSGTTLLHHMQLTGSDGLVVTEQWNQPVDNLAVQPITASDEREATQVNDSILLGNASGIIDLSLLEKPLSIGEYSEGIAPAENAEGLWGFVDGNGDWLVAPKYASVSAVQNMQASVVRTDGITQTVLFSKN